jgi:hypothetical protein
MKLETLFNNNLEKLKERNMSFSEEDRYFFNWDETETNKHKGRSHSIMSELFLVANEAKMRGD